MNYTAGYPMYYQAVQNPQMQLPTGNPYIDRLAQLQMQMQQQQQPVTQNMPLNGKIVDSIESVKATDIPMDGNTYYFPKADGTEVYAKKWVEGGKTRIWTYRANLEDDVTNSMGVAEKRATEGDSALLDVAVLLRERLDSLNTRFDSLDTSISNIADEIRGIQAPKNTKGKREEQA